MGNNSKRLTPQSYVVLESVVLKATARGSLGIGLQDHIRHFLRTPRLHWMARIRLVLTYLVRRCTGKNKIGAQNQGCAGRREFKRVQGTTQYEGIHRNR